MAGMGRSERNTFKLTTDIVNKPRINLTRYVQKLYIEFYFI